MLNAIKETWAPTLYCTMLVLGVALSVGVTQ